MEESTRDTTAVTCHLDFFGAEAGPKRRSGKGKGGGGWKDVLRHFELDPAANI